MSVTTEDPVERAKLLHWKWCERNGYIPDQPGDESYLKGDVVTLVNVRGVMGRYKVGPSGRLRRLDG